MGQVTHLQHLSNRRHHERSSPIPHRGPGSSELFWWLWFDWLLPSQLHTAHRRRAAHKELLFIWMKTCTHECLRKLPESDTISSLCRLRKCQAQREGGSRSPSRTWSEPKRRTPAGDRNAVKIPLRFSKYPCAAGVATEEVRSQGRRQTGRIIHCLTQGHFNGQMWTNMRPWTQK